MYVISQIFSSMALLFYCLSLFKKKYNKIVDGLIISSSLFMISNLFLKAYAGFCGCFISCFRDILYHYKLKKDYIFLIVIVLMILYGAFFVRNIISIFPIISVIFYSAILIYSKKILSIKTGAAINNFLWFIYDIHFLNIASSICDLIIIFTAVISIVLSKKRK